MKDMNMWDDVMVSMNSNSDLEQAVVSGDLEAVKRSVGNGANINYMPSDNSVMMIAGFNKHWDIVDYLIDNGANINLTNLFNYHIIHVLAKDGPLDIIQKVVSLSAGTVINHRDNDRDTAFSIAVKENREEVVDFFLDLIGTDITCLDIDGKSTLHYAAELGHKDMFMKLWFQGVSLEHEDKHGKHAVDYIADEAWRDELPQFEKVVTEAKIIREELKENKENVEVAVVDTLKATGISSIKKRVKK